MAFMPVIIVIFVTTVVTDAMMGWPDRRRG